MRGEAACGPQLDFDGAGADRPHVDGRNAEAHHGGAPVRGGVRVIHGRGHVRATDSDEGHEADQECQAQRVQGTTNQDWAT
jgi:hypothetical protein